MEKPVCLLKKVSNGWKNAAERAQRRLISVNCFRLSTRCAPTEKNDFTGLTNSGSSRPAALQHPCEHRLIGTRELLPV